MEVKTFCSANEYLCGLLTGLSHSLLNIVQGIAFTVFVICLVSFVVYRSRISAYRILCSLGYSAS